MSQTETLLLFVLGFCVALLFVLLFGRAVWAAIGRWSGWRQKRGLPIAILELQAERDSLKAEKAMLAKRAEAAAADLKMRMAETMAEAARNRNRVLDLTSSLKASQAEVDVLKSTKAALESQIEALKLQIEDNVRAINDAWQKATHHNSETERAKLVVAQLNGELEARQQRIANLESEMRALREIIGMFVPTKGSDAAVEELRHFARPVETTRQTGFSEAALVLESGIQGSGNAFLQLETRKGEAAPVLLNDNTDGVPAASPQVADSNNQKQQTEDATSLDGNVSNVLSLAERVRNLQRNLRN